MLDFETWASGSIPTRGNILLPDFLFSYSETSDTNIGIIANVVYLWKTRIPLNPSQVSRLFNMKSTVGKLAHFITMNIF